ncbi:MAG: ribonuclease E/G [Robiginitomaculum sp.]|nr:MAG: ribonuclease E/G [Robiginitomaculum sp.]
MRKFMSKRMLIDAAHPEQTRVAVVDGNRVEEFDFESQSKKQLRGNIYLAKITRVEASLQAAFVDYGGNRHGFLAFNEIHPDYYQIPVKDREELIRLEEEEEEAAEAAEAAQEAKLIVEDNGDNTLEEGVDADVDDDSDDDLEEDTDAAEEAAIAAEAAERRRRRRVRELRRYKIQEVIKPGQVLLAQVSKEERGNKGAALTTYLSLAGRYCVLMPNTARGGGISRKISNASDRKRLKSVTASLDLPKGVGLIIRTAGSKRTKVEIKRDFEYLGRLWSIIRENTLSAMAPALVHQEGGLVRRAVRDLYDKDIEAIYVEGEQAYHEAHDFMKMLMPSHAARVKQYKGPFPIFLKYQVEEQLEAIYDSNVRLKSGGYLVIHQTEALVAIDVNSGRSTKERNIEATALKTNLEAADEASRQMRLRDLAGLLVIDFIDMDENKNVRAVEKRMKDALKRDRARVQMGRISGFGLMEISRQRRRASVIEGSSQVCPTCAGIGVVRSVESAALSALQAMEGEAMKGMIAKARLTIPTKVALYLLNEKREFLANMERELDFRLIIDADSGMHPPKFEIETLERRQNKSKAARMLKSAKDSDEEEGRHGRNHQQPETTETSSADETEPKHSAPDTTVDGTEEMPKKRRRGRRGGRGRRKNATNTEANANVQSTSEDMPVTSSQTEATQSNVAVAETSETTGKPRRRRRRPRNADTSTETVQTSEEPVKAEATEVAEQARPKRPVRRRRKSRDAEVTAEAEPAVSDDATAPVTANAKAEPEENPKRPVRRRRRPRNADAETAPVAVTETPKANVDVAVNTDEKPKRPARRRRKARSADVETETVQENIEATPVASSTGPDEKSKRPARRRRKPASAKTEAPQADAETASIQAIATPEDKPKRPVRRRRKPASAKAETIAKATPAQTQKDSPPVEDAKPKRRAVRPRKAKAADTQKAPKVSAGDENETPQTEGETPDKANKKSWWARRFNA